VLVVDNTDKQGLLVSGADSRKWNPGSKLSDKRAKEKQNISAW